MAQLLLKRLWMFFSLGVLVAPLCIAVAPMQASAATPGTSGFDHFATGFPLTGAHANASCVSCHRGGIFRKLPVDCNSCHQRKGLTKTATILPNNHIRTTGKCTDCHSTQAWSPIRFMDHTQVSGSCASCHNGSTAKGKNSRHIASGSNCDACHTTNAWIPAAFDHATVTGNCASCHNGSTATGKTGSHFVTNLQCDTCHTKTAWLPVIFRHSSGAYPGDHSANLACKTCHTSNSQTMTWRFPAYQPDCASCHASNYKQSAHKKIDKPRTYYSVSELRDCTGSCHTYTDSSMTKILKHRSGPEHRVSKGSW